MDKKITSLTEYFSGLMTAQNLVLQYLIKKGVVDKDEISNALDFMIDDFNGRMPEQAVTLALGQIRLAVDHALPDFPPPAPDPARPKAKHPGWLKGIIDGGKS